MSNRKRRLYRTPPGNLSSHLQRQPQQTFHMAHNDVAVERNAGKRRAEKALAKLDDAAPRVRLTGWLGSHPQRITIALVYATGMTFGLTTGLVCDSTTELTGD